MLKTIQKIREEIRNHDKVKNSLLGLTDDWKTSHFNTLATIINTDLMSNEMLQGERRFELGNTISSITLKRLFEHSISETATKDLRFLKTLDKICIFLGYYQFNDFVSKYNEHKTAEINKLISNDSEAKYFRELILGCAKCEYENIKKLPEFDAKIVEEYVIVDSPYYTRITNYLKELSSKGLKLLNTPKSSYEIYDIEIKSKSENLVVINTQEFWNLNFWDDEEKLHHYHTLNSQNYFVKKDTDEKWKIWDNHNPNVWELTEKI